MMNNLISTVNNLLVRVSVNLNCHSTGRFAECWIYKSTFYLLT